MRNVDWVKAALAHKETPRIPFNMSFTPPARRRASIYYGTDDVEGLFGFPIAMNAPVSVKPMFADAAHFGDMVYDEFGIGWSTGVDDRGSPVRPCLPEPSLTGYRFPDPKAAYRFEGLADWCSSHGDDYRVLWVGDLWERATFMRGMENLLLDVALHEAFVDALLHELSQGILETMGILFATCAFEAVALSDDYGTQHGLLLSPASWRRLIAPRVREIYATARRHGRAVLHHSCGNILPIIPDLIDAGLDVLHPIQPEAMDVRMLKKAFGTDLSFCGGLRTQDLLPRGTPEEVRREVRELQRDMGAGGGYILEPGITVQADVPTANIVALLDAADGRRA